MAGSERQSCVANIEGSIDSSVDSRDVESGRLERSGVYRDSFGSGVDSRDAESGRVERSGVYCDSCGAGLSDW